MKRPSIKSPCVADRYHTDGERIAEVTFPDGRGCLLRIYTSAGGTPCIEVYRADAGITVDVEDATSLRGQR